MRLITFLFKYSRATTILAVIIGLVCGAGNAGLVAAIHTALSGPGARTPGLVFKFAALSLIVPGFRLLSSILLTSLSQRGIYDMRRRLSRQIALAPLRQIEEFGSHRIIATLTEDVFVITNTLIKIPVLCMQLAVVVGILVYLAWLSWAVLLAVVVFMAVGALSFKLAVNRAMKYLVTAREYADTLLGHFRALTDGAKELKLHRRRRTTFLADVMEEAMRGLRRNNVTGTNTMSLSSSLSNFLFFTLLGLLLFALPAFQPTDDRLLTGYVLAIFYLLIPFEDLTSLIPAVARANIAMGKVESLGLSLIDAAKKEPVLADAPEPGPEWESLELVGVTHTYHRERENTTFTLGPIDLSFRPGELTFLVGGNGSGKTTLAKLITGLYTPEGGEIRFNGRPVTDENRDDYRQFFSVVFYDFFLFEKLLGLETGGLDERAREYLGQLQLDHKVQVKEGVLSTIDLSQGQRKRLALLTAFLEDRPFYIFDEWAADQDPVFRDVFYLELLPELKARGKTVLVISHDDRYYHLGDRVIKLDYGRIEYDRVLAPEAELTNSAEPVAS
ncbi:MAG TPA: cyclic peptide export ABC transporter [Pyrinomonadaceae bacterium]|jgi:putative ATP-binding cassette transporter